MKIIAIPLTLAATMMLGACSQSNERQTDAQIAAKESAAAVTDDSAMTTDDDQISPRPASTPGIPTAAVGKTLALEGLGDLQIGKAAPAAGSFAERGGQTGEDCRTLSSPDFPGVYVITKGKGGPVHRITVGEGSKIRLAEGIGVGATEQEVRAAFPGFRPSPHKYVEAPGKYLTQPGDDPRLRFEIAANGRVSQVHVGVMPELGYVEGCA